MPLRSVLEFTRIARQVAGAKRQPSADDLIALLDEAEHRGVSPKRLQDIVLAFRSFPDERSAIRLEQLSERHRSPEIRNAVAVALGAMPNATAREALCSLAESDDLEVRAQADLSLEELRRTARSG